LWAWAEKHVHLPGSITESGRFNCATSNYLKAPLEALQDNTVRRVSLRWPIRSGKTLVSQLFIAWSVANDLGPTMYLLPTFETAKDMADNRIRPILMECAPVLDRLKSDPDATKRATINFLGGATLWIRGMTKSELQAKSVRYLLLDEPYFSDQSLIPEALGRQGDWVRAGTSKTLVMCQGSDSNDWTDEDFLAGSQELLHFDCGECGEAIPARLWGDRVKESWGLVWESHKDEAGDYDFNKILPTVRYKCPHCGHLHRDTPRTKRQWNSTSRYIAQNPNAPRDHRSFTFSAIICYPWQELVKDWLNARKSAKSGDLGPLAAFIQKKMATPWNSDYLIDTVRAATGDYQPDATWPDEFVRIASVDVQSNDLFYLVVRAWARDGRSRLLYFNKVYGWESLARTIIDTWKVPPKRTVVDCGYNTGTVLRFCAKHGFIAAKGTDQERFFHTWKQGKGTAKLERAYSMPVVADAKMGTKDQGKGVSCVQFQFSDPRLSDTLNALRNDGNTFQTPQDWDPETEKMYLKQVGAMVKKLVLTKTKLGENDDKSNAISRKKWRWVATSKDNHAFDCEKMNVLMAMILKILPDPVESEAS
jgi:phage terminase large subunit GpA-like protein